MRGATPLPRRCLSMNSRLQSTHPSRGATTMGPDGQDDGPISIHAPLTGCDSAARPWPGPTATFQSTHPSRGATRIDSGPSQGCKISIHAPLTGCDWSCGISCPSRSYFNPRTPHGVRRFSGLNQGRRPTHFNPRTPHGVRHSPDTVHPQQVEFQSTHPSRGATHTDIFATNLSLFQSTHPSRGAT